MITPEPDTQTVRKVRNIYLVIISLVAIAALVMSAFAFNDARQRADGLRQASLESCEVAGNQVRDVLRTVLESQIEAANRVTHDLFPNIPLATFRDLQRRAQKDRREALRDLDMLPTCEDRFGTHSLGR